MPKDHIDYCSWLEIARLMGWVCSKEDLGIVKEPIDDPYWKVNL